MSKNIFLTGFPGTGKTTAIRSLIDCLAVPTRGFLTEEIREHGRRTGFMIQTLDGNRGHLAHIDIKSPHRVSKYGVSIENIDSIAVPSIEVTTDEEIIVIDEVGKMECFSEKFRAAVTKALNSPVFVIGTIARMGGGFIASVKKRPDVEVIEITRNNRDAIPAAIMRKVRPTP
jgi:nucleoside-triphosphatase